MELNPENSVRWDRLLAFVAGGASDDGAAYQRVHARLIRFFDWKGHTDATTLADETLDRVAKRLAEAVEVLTDEPVRYVLGVARFIHLETVKRERRAREALERPDAPPASADDQGEEAARLAALQSCLGELYETERTLILTYHAGRGQTRIDARRRLADGLGINLNTLRIRAYRIRARLETCVKKRLG